MRLACSDIAYRYPGAEGDTFRRLSFTMDEPGLHALFGPSGVGKTTLARILSGDLAADDGTVDFDGPGPRLYAYNLERLPDWSSVGRHIERVTPGGRSGRREALVAAFGLEGVMGSRFSNLSLKQAKLEQQIAEASQAVETATAALQVNLKKTSTELSRTLAALSEKVEAKPDPSALMR